MLILICAIRSLILSCSVNNISVRNDADILPSFEYIYIYIYIYKMSSLLFSYFQTIKPSPASLLCGVNLTDCSLVIFFAFMIWHALVGVGYWITLTFQVASKRRGLEAWKPPAKWMGTLKSGRLFKTFCWSERAVSSYSQGSLHWESSL